MIIKCLQAGVFIGMVCGVSAANPIWENDFSKFKTADSPDKGWVLKDLSEEVSDKGLRMRETGEANEGYMSCEIKYEPAAKYIQVKAGVAENAGNMFYMNIGGEKYKIYTGWNTFLINDKEIKNGKLNITISLKGKPGKEPGGWADLESIRVVENPLDSLTISLLNKKDNTAQIGDTLMFKYAPSTQILEKELEADCFVAPEMSDYRFNGEIISLNDKGVNGDEKAGDGIYSCVIKIDKNALTFKSESGKSLIGSVHAAGMNSYTYIPFSVDIKTANKVEAPVFKGGNPDIIKYRKLWAQYTRGENLALGKKFIFSKKPDYALTSKGGTDESDLTDGKLSTSGGDTIWFDSATVGWYMSGAENGVNCLLDLGEEKPVGDVVARLLAGKAQGSLGSPAEFKIFVSLDGKNFYETAAMVKLMQAEKELCNFKTNYYIDEIGKAYAYPFKLEVNANARYVGIYIKGETGAVFTDEIAVMAGDTSKAGFNDAYKTPAQKFITTGLLIEPRLKELAISTNINTPNAFQVSDMREKDAAGKPTMLVVEVPEGINIIAPNAKKEGISIDGNKYTRFELPLKKSSTNPQTEMLYFTADKTANVQLPAIIYGKSEGRDYDKSSVPIKTFEIPEIKTPFKRLHVSLAWMGEQDQRAYPDFFKAWKTMGFNAVACFPRYWQNGSEKNKQESLAYLAAARKEGFAVVMDESPFHVMAKGHKEGSEIYSQLKSGQKSKNLCPSYNGPFYEKEMERIAQGVALAKPDYVFWDIECWYHGAKEAPACTRCIAAQKESGKSMEEFLKSCGVEKMKSLNEAVRKGIGTGKVPLIHCYDTHPTSPNYDGISDFNRFYPQYVDTAANSLYVAGNVLRVHDEIRENYKILKSNNNIPWLSAGCYGEFDPYKLEQMILEALLNGARGITYYCYSDFDTSRDFYYHAKALSEIAPYEDLILDGTIITDMEGTNKALTYSGIKKGNEMLLLVGNYKRAADGKSEIKLPFKSIIEIKDLRDNGKSIKSDNNLVIDVPKDQIVLYYIKGK